MSHLRSVGCDAGLMRSCSRSSTVLYAERRSPSWCCLPVYAFAMTRNRGMSPYNRILPKSASTHTRARGDFLGPVRLAGSAPPPSKEPREESEGISLPVLRGRWAEVRGPEGVLRTATSGRPFTYPLILFIPRDVSPILTGPEHFRRAGFVTGTRGCMVSTKVDNARCEGESFGRRR